MVAKEKTESKGNQILRIQLSFDPAAGELFREIDSHLISLRNVLRPIKDGTYTEAGQPSGEGFLAVTLSNDVGTVSELTRKEILKTFQNIIRSVINFIDTVLSIESIRIHPPKMPKDEISVQEVIKEYDRAIIKKLKQISSNSHLTNASKLQRLPELEKDNKDALMSYFETRRSIEHHKSIAQKKLTTKIIRQKLVTEDGTEIKIMPVRFEKPTTISITRSWANITTAKDTAVSLTEKDIEDLIMTIRLSIVPDILTKLVQLN